MNSIKIGKSNILFYKPPKFVTDYYNYILEIIQKILIKNKYSVNIILDSNYCKRKKNKQIKLTNKTILININFEHTIVKEGGRNTSNAVFGKLKYDKLSYYLVNIEELSKLNSSHIIIDYSLPNVVNVKESNLFSDFSKKHIYIAPTIYKNIQIQNLNRNINSLTTFINVKEPRRNKLLSDISNSTLIHKNINNCFTKKELQDLYQNTKVLINIRQTPHRCTFEELRCLPALQNGVIIVSEKVPLTEIIPYKDLIIWCHFDEIINKTQYILENYEEYFQKIFTKENIQLLQNIHLNNERILKKKILKLCKQC